MTNNIPDWNLDSIYHDINCKEYKSSLAELESGISKLAALHEKAESQKNNFDFSSWFYEYILEDDKLLPLSNTLAAYSYSIYSTDTTNKSYLDNLNKVDDLINLYDVETTKLYHTLLENEKSLEDFYKAHPEYEKYRFAFEEIIFEAKHTLSPAEEKIISKLQQTGGNAWDRLHEQLISNMRDEETNKLFNELRNDAYSADPKIRQTAWKKEVALLKQNEIAFGACLNNLKGETTSLLDMHKWEDAISHSLNSSRMKKETLDALISAIEESLPDWRKYLRAKAEYLKNHNATNSTSCGKDKGIAFYDLFAPLTASTSNTSSSNATLSETSTNSEFLIQHSALTKTWTFDEARDYIIKEYNSFSPKMGDFAKNAFDKNWIDARVHPGKVGGAYCQDFYVQKESRVLSNFTGAFSDIITLAHELGHAFHFNCIKDKDFRNGVYPMTLAETASTFAETIVKQDIIKTCSADDKIKILELDLQDACQVLIDILCRFYFERSVFEERKNGELTAEDFCRLMKDAQEKSYGNGLNDERHKYMWAVKSHYYSTELDFYNFPYAFGQLFSAGLYARFLKEGKDFVDVYCSLLADTGSMTCEDLCKKAGFDITKKEFWKTGIEMYKKEIEEFCRLAGC